MSDPQLLDESQTTWATHESEGATALALKMTNQSTQQSILTSTARTVIDLLPMRWTLQMLIQATQSSVAVLTEVTAVVRSIPSSTGSDVCRISSVLVPANLLVGEYVVGIDLSAVLIDGGTSDAGGAGAGFQVDTDTVEVGEFVGTPRALDIFADMDG